MWAIGKYEKVPHRTENTKTALNFTRSAKAPMMRAGVMAAKVIWKAMNRYSGITMPGVKVAAMLSTVTPDRNSLPVPPHQGLVEPPNERE